MPLVDGKCAAITFQRVFSGCVDAKGERAGEEVQHTAQWIMMLLESWPHLLPDCRSRFIPLLKHEKEGINAIALRFVRASPAAEDKKVVKKIVKECVRLAQSPNREIVKHAIFAIKHELDDPQEAKHELENVLQRAVDGLKDTSTLPSALQAIACTAQCSPAIFSAKESEIVPYVVNDVLRRTTSSSESPTWESPSIECRNKVLGIKALARAYDASGFPEARIQGLLRLLSKIIPHGDVPNQRGVVPDTDDEQVLLAYAYCPTVTQF